MHSNSHKFHICARPKARCHHLSLPLVGLTTRKDVKHQHDFKPETSRLIESRDGQRALLNLLRAKRGTHFRVRNTVPTEQRQRMLQLLLSVLADFVSSCVVL
eukprot:1741384-Amphidinium_carterae.1